MRQDQLEAFVDQVAAKWQMGGFDNSTMYGEFAVEVAKLAVAAEREACAKTCENADKSTHPADLADAIRAR